MNLWIGFSPWILFWTLISYWSVPMAAWITLAASLIINIRSFLKHRPKILEIGSLVFFLWLCIDSLFIHASWLNRWIFTVQNASLLITILISIVIGRPFSEQYAREVIAQDLRDSLKVIHTCKVINTVWIVMLAALTIGSTSRVFWKNPIPWVFSVTHMAFFFPVMQFTNRKLNGLKHS